MPQPPPKIDAAVSRLLECLRTAAAERRSGDYTLKVDVRDGVIKGVFIKQDEKVAH